MSRLLRCAVAAVAGFVLNLAFPDANVWPLALVALGLLWWVLEESSAWAGFFQGWLFGVAFLAPHVWWAYSAVGPVPWVALSIVEGMAFGLFGMAWAHVNRSGILDRVTWLHAPVFAALWVGVEQLRSMVPFGGFPWGRVAFSQQDSPLVRLAWLGGAPLVSLAVVTVGALLAIGVLALRRRQILQGVIAPSLAIAIVLAGLMVPIDSRAQDGTLIVGAVQGNVPNAGLDAFANAREVTGNHLEGTRQLVAADLGDMDLLLWPENSADYDPRTDQATNEMVTEAARLAQAPLLLGTNDYSVQDGRFNASLLWTSGGGVLGQYNKQRPAPFAEYIPIRDIARKFSADVDRVRTDMVAGDEPGVMTLPVERLERTVKVGVVICFEVAYDSIVLDSVREGAEVLFIQTNNANFGATAESTQQLAMSRFRAIETGRATIQISTVGVSGVITPSGRVVQDTGLFTAEQLFAELPLRTSMTPAVRFGTPIQWAMLILPGIILARGIQRRLGDRYEW